MSYREPGRDIDATEIERAKIHEAAETKRKAIEEKEKTRRENIAKRDTAGYIVPKIVTGCVLLTAALCGMRVASDYVEARQPAKPCVDQVRKRSEYISMTCERPEQLLVSDKDEWVCRCPRATAPAHSGDRS